MSTASRFGQAATTTAKPAQAATAPINVKPSKYTLLIAPAVAAALRDDETRLLRLVGSEPKRSEIFRILLEMLHDDQTIFDEVARRYRIMDAERRTSASTA